VYSGENPRGIRFCILYVQHRGIAAPIFGVRDFGAFYILFKPKGGKESIGIVILQ
jgi:hypothetical protein